MEWDNLGKVVIAQVDNWGIRFRIVSGDIHSRRC